MYVPDFYVEQCKRRRIHRRKIGAKNIDYVDPYEMARANFEKYAKIPLEFGDVVALRAVFRTEQFLTKSAEGSTILDSERERVEFVASVEKRKRRLVTPSIPIVEYRQTLNKKYIYDLTSHYILGFIDKCRTDETEKLQVRKKDWEYVVPLIKQYLDIDHRDYTWSRVHNALIGRVRRLRDGKGNLEASLFEARALYDYVKSAITGVDSA